MRLNSIESFVNGVSTGRKYINALTGELLPDYFIPQNNDIVDANPQWESFIRGMFIDAGYNRIINLPNTSIRAVTRLETACNVWIGNQSSSLDLVIQFFNELIGGLEANAKPTAEEILQWQGFADDFFIAVLFSPEGLMIPI